MALLLAMYQKLRLIRERNQLTLEMSQTSSKLTRIEKNIERTQKYYTSLFQQIDSQAKILQNNATRAIQNMAGLGVGSFNPYGMSAYSGMNGFVAKYITDIFKPGKGEFTYKDSENNEQVLKCPEYEKMINEYYRKGGFVEQKDTEGKPTGTYGEGGYSKEEVDAFNYMMQMGIQKQQEAQFNAQQMSSNFANGISIWTDAMKADLECQQDAALEPLTYEQTMLELDKNLKEQRLKRIEAELESYSQLVDKGAEEMAPKFGLG